MARIDEASSLLFSVGFHFRESNIGITKGVVMNHYDFQSNHAAYIDTTSLPKVATFLFRWLFIALKKGRGG
jgi:hypothetical protein